MNAVLSLAACLSARQQKSMVLLVLAALLADGASGAACGSTRPEAESWPAFSCSEAPATAPGW